MNKEFVFILVHFFAAFSKRVDCFQPNNVNQTKLTAAKWAVHDLTGGGIKKVMILYVDLRECCLLAFPE